MDVQQIGRLLDLSERSGQWLQALVVDDGQWKERIGAILRLADEGRIELQSSDQVVIQAAFDHGRENNRWLSSTAVGMLANRRVRLKLRDSSESARSGFVDFCHGSFSALALADAEQVRALQSSER